jgi:FkbM family methyltransferase
MKSAPLIHHCPDTMRPHVDRVLAGEYDPTDICVTSGVMTVLDIGANVGAFTAWALAKFPGCKVTAYEPHPDNAEMFKLNVTSPQVELHQHAVWNADGPVMLKDGANNCGEAQVSRDGNKRVWGIDALDLPPADFIKIDAEGSEEVILSRYGHIAQAKFVALEWHSAELRESCVKHLQTCGLERVYSYSYNAETGVEIWAHPSVINRPAKPTATAAKVFLALPVYGGYHAHFVHCLIKLIQSPPVPMAIKPNAGDSLVSRSRNVLAAEFLKSDCTHLLFLDTDLIFSGDQIKRLVEHDLPIVAGLYPKKQRELAWVCNMLPDEQPDANGIQRIKYAGTGCLLIKREVFERMIDAHPEIAYRPDNGEEGEKWDFFSVGVHKGRYLSEDWFFCQRALDLGYDVCADTRVILKHVGEAIYPIDNPFDSDPKA